MSKSEESQKIYMMYSKPVQTEHGPRIMIEKGVISGLEIDATKNYILIPLSVNNVTTSWSIHELSDNSKNKFKIHEDEDRWIDND